jgi:hypothetical protein
MELTFKVGDRVNVIRKPYQNGEDNVGGPHWHGPGVVVAVEKDDVWPYLVVLDNKPCPPHGGFVCWESEIEPLIEA